MLRAPLQRLYERLGPRYPRVVLALRVRARVLRGGRRRAAAQPVRRHLAGHLLAHRPRLGGPRRRSRSAPPCGWATGSCARPTAGCAASARPRPRWPPGRRSPGCPCDLLRFGRGMPVALNTIPISIFLTLELDGTFLSFLAIAAGALVVLAYGVFLRFFVTELAMRPVLADVSLRPARRRRPRRALGAAARQAARRAAGHQRRHRRRGRRPGLRGPEPARARRRGAGRARRRLHALLRALGSARALGGRADRGPARGDRARDRGRPRRPRARARHRRDRAPGGVLQPDGRRPGGARAPARGVRRLRRPAARRARARGGHRDRGRGGRGDRPLRRHPRVHGLRRARQRDRGRRRAQRLLRARRARARAPRRATPTSSSATGCSASSARPSTSPTTPTAAWRRRSRSPRSCAAPTAGGCASASASTPARWWPAPSAAAAASSSPSSATPSTPPRAWRGSRARRTTPCS